MKFIVKLISIVLLVILLSSCTPTSAPATIEATSNPITTETAVDQTVLREIPDRITNYRLYENAMYNVNKLISNDAEYVLYWYYYRWRRAQITTGYPNLNQTESIYNLDMISKLVDYLYDVEAAITKNYRSASKNSDESLEYQKNILKMQIYCGKIDILDALPRPIVKEIISTYHYCGDDLIAAGMLDIIYEARKVTSAEDWNGPSFIEYCYERFAEIEAIDEKNSIEKDFHAALVEHINQKYATFYYAAQPHEEVQLYALGLNRHSELLETIFGISTQEFMKLPEHQRDRYMQVLSERIYAHVSIPELVYAYGITKDEFDQVFFNFWYRDNHYNREDIHTYRYDIMIEDRAIIEKMISNATSPQDVYKLNAYIRIKE